MTRPTAYFDNAATTPVRAEVLDAMLPYLGGELFGNPSSAHGPGRAARSGLERARREIAEALGVEPSEVIFTSGGTEADNLAVIGAALRARTAGRPMLVSVPPTEHKAVLAAAHAVAHLGGTERFLPVDGTGLLDLAGLDLALAEQPAVVSVMWVNNETGVIQPIEEIARRCAARSVPFHTDLVQAFGKVPVSLTSVSLATLSGHKLGAPKGIGALIVRRGVALEPLIHGGGQQRGVRPGTENIAGAVALGRAVALAAAEQAAEAARLGALRDELAARLRTLIPDLVVAGDGAPRAPHILNMMIPGTRSEALLMHLDMAGIAASGGSACSTGTPEPSHVLSAMGFPAELAFGAVRLSLGRGSTAEDITLAIEAFPGAVTKVRKLTETLNRG